MKISGLLQRHRLLSGVLIATVTGALQAAPLNLPTPYPDPDITTHGTSISYIYDGDGSNRLTITGAGGLVSSQVITIPDGNSLNGGVNSLISAVPGGAGVAADLESGYLLTADFNDSGDFLGGAVEVTGYAVNPYAFGTSTAPEAFFAGTNTGTILTLDLDRFGFSGTPASAGDRDTVILEWGGIVTGGDLNILGFAGPVGGAVAVGNVFWGTDDPLEALGGTFGGAWDPLEINDMTAFTSSFVSCDGFCPVLVDTFVPVPAAVWLFGSGLLGLIGTGMRRKK